MSTITPPPTATATTSATTATSTCTTAVPDKYGHVPYGACNSNYNFDPSFEANLAFLVLFALTTLTHIVQAIIFKKTFCWVLIMGGLWETAAFTLRTLGAHDQQQLIYAIIGTILFLLAPLWINAFIYMVVARLVHFTLPDKSIWGIRGIKLTTLFVGLDILSFIVQLGGGSMLSNNDHPDIAQIGMKVYVAGIGVQLAFVVIFGGMTIWYYVLVHRLRRGQMGMLRYLVWVMLLVLALIVIRIVYRLVEFGPGLNANNQLITKEIYPLALDASPMVLALMLLNLVHPGLVLRGPDSEFPKVTRAEKKAIKRQKKEEKQQRKEEKKMRKNMNGSITSEDWIRLEEGNRG